MSPLDPGGAVFETYPAGESINDDVPEPARTYLQQAADSMHAPSGAVMLAASAVDAMLKAKGLSEGSLYSRIDAAAVTHLITADMATWAHDVRLDANEPRHADNTSPLPDIGKARKCVEFAKALAEVIFVLPKRVERGIKSTESAEA